MAAPRRIQGPIWAAALTLLLVAGGLAVTAPAGPEPLAGGAERTEFLLPHPDEDADLDSYADAIDRVAGDAHVAIRIDKRPAGATWVGTQDDQWRLGAERELEWRHVVDMAPRLKSPSRAWNDANLRTGAWVDASGHDEVVLNIRDDAQQIVLEFEAWLDGREQTGSLLLPVSIAAGGAGQSFSDSGFSGEVRVFAAPPVAQRQLVAERWAPVLHFDAGELFFPVSGSSLENFDGFAPQHVVLAPWDANFNNGRDDYLLLMTDFDHDGTIGYADAARRMDGLRKLGGLEPTVLAQAAPAHDGQFIVQYWFLYHYNFVLGDNGREMPHLAHEGDREFIQLVFPSLTDALLGTPDTIAYSQHYHGLVLPANDAAPHVYVARGSHASYPVAGDAGRQRPALQGYQDQFYGDGDVWTPGNYTVELATSQSWLHDNLWNPVTRHSRDLGTATKPLLRHDFRYPWLDPLAWQATLHETTWEEAVEAYGVAP